MVDNSVIVANGRFKNILGKDESRSVFAAPNSGSIEIPDTISDSDDASS